MIFQSVDGHPVPAGGFYVHHYFREALMICETTMITDHTFYIGCGNEAVNNGARIEQNRNSAVFFSRPKNRVRLYNSRVSGMFFSLAIFPDGAEVFTIWVFWGTGSASTVFAGSPWGVASQPIIILPSTCATGVPTKPSATSRKCRRCDISKSLIDNWSGCWRRRYNLVILASSVHTKIAFRCKTPYT